MTFKEIFEKIAYIIEQALLIINSAALVAVSTVVFAEILSRNVFGYSFIWVEEFTLIVFGWLAFLSAAYTLRKKGHVALEFLYKKFPMNLRKGLYVFFTIGMCLFFVYIFKSGLDNCRLQMKIPMTHTHIPRGWMYMGLPVGSILMTYFSIVEFVETIFWKDETAIKISEELVQYNTVVGGA